MDLSSEDLLLVHRLTLDLYRALDPEEQIVAMLAVLSELVPCDLAAWNEFNLATKQLRLVTAPHFGATHQEQVEACSRYAHQSPFPAYYAASGDRSWRMIADFMPVEDFQKTDFCQQALRSFGPHQIACVLTTFNDDVKALTLNRIDRPFSERDRAVLNLLLPHLSLSHYNAHAFDRANQSIRELQSVVESAPSGYAYAGQTARIEWATDKARNLWAQFYAHDTKDEAGVPTPVRSWMRERLAHVSNGGTARTADFVQRILGTERLETRLIPAAVGGWILAVELSPVADRPRCNALPQLSARENEVLRWMTEGKRNSEIAVILGISPRTVEKHVEAVLAGLTVENRAAAIVTAMGLSAAMNAQVKSADE